MRKVPSWSGDKLARDKFTRNATEIPRYAETEARFAKYAQNLVSDFLSGRVDRNQLISRFKNRLSQAETDAFVAGRRARGDNSATINEGEAQMLTGRHSRNMRYFNKFVRDMEEGRGRMSYADRAELYAKSLWSLYTRGESSDWDDPQEQRKRYYWVMDPAAEHCKTCMDRAARSIREDGFSWEQLVAMGFPGESTDCQVNCRCHIQVISKRKPKDVSPSGPEPSHDLATDEVQSMPAAGLPMVSLPASSIEQSVRVAHDPGALKKALPTLGQTMKYPISVQDDGLVRTYTGDNLLAKVKRDPQDGLWKIFFLGLLKNAKDKTDGSNRLYQQQ